MHCVIGRTHSSAAVALPSGEMNRIFRRIVRVSLSLVVAGALGVGGWFAYRYHGPTAAVEIYRGITYGCDRLAETDQGGGLVHWVRADLTVPGVRLYVTPVDPSDGGWEYRLRHVSTTVADQGLAAAVNGTLFRSDSTVVRLPGDRARSIETAVADGAFNHVDPNTYLLWWDAVDVAHLERTKPPSAAVLDRARWGIGGQVTIVVDGHVGGWMGPGPTDARTVIGADPDRKRVWIVCLERASDRRAAEVLVGLGATVGVAVDGGTSTAMALGGTARGVRPGTVCGNWRPVATAFGFRAEPVR